MQLSNPALRTPPSEAPCAPFVALLRDGAVVTGEDAAVRIGDLRVGVPARVVTAAVVGGQVWVATRGALRRFRADGKELGAPLPLPELVGDVAIIGTQRGPRAALIESERWCALVRERDDDSCAADELGVRTADRRILVGARTAERRGACIRLGQLELAIPADLAAGRIGASALVLDGSTLLVELVGATCSTVALYNLRHGKLNARIRIGESRVAAVADRAGLVVLAGGEHLALLDLRVGRCSAERILASSVVACAIDEAGTMLAIVDAAGNTIRLGRALTDIDGATSNAAGAIVVLDAPAANDDAPAANDDAPAANDGARAANDGAPAANDDALAADDGPAVATSDDPQRTAEVRDIDAPAEVRDIDAPAAVRDIDAPAAVRDVDAPAEARVVDAPAEVASATDAFGSSYLHALGAPRAESLSPEALAEYLAAAHAWVEAVCALAVAARRSDASALATARERERVTGERFAAWRHRGAPHVELAHELDLSPLAATALLLIAAPQIWCELAREYATVVADASRPLVDEVLIATLLQAGIVEQSALARELDGSAPLVRSGAVVVAAGVRPFAALSVHPSVARRLAGATIDPASHAATASWVLDFADFVGPREAVVALAAALEEPRSMPVRVALRGKPGSGRRTVAAMLAARAGREVDVVGATAPELAQRLRDVALRGHVPVVDLGGLSIDDEARWAGVRAALDGHAGPLFVRAERNTELPFTPTECVDFPMLGETERAACWRLHLDDAARADVLAERYAIGPGAIARAAATPDPMAALRASRGQRVARLAERVERLASWDDLVVTPDVGDALRELVARVRYRRTVLETWGMGEVATTARGVTALFQGGPGTGKTMAAGVVARALGYELWRVDLSKVVSKWIGETERNLAQLFDAAEEGEIVLLFDEADALFTKRTEVRSSNDKHANAATNYLLQRIDSFTGIAILTTNFGTAIDAAFRRRLAVHVEFPFPDESERLRLWHAHLPRALPTRGDLELRELAETYELSGGYIRNVALRAAYLAAGRSDAPAITADDLRRAIKLEKERIGKLGNGRIE